MLKEIIRFEFAYRRKRPATYLYFALCLALGFIFTGTESIKIIGGGGQLKENAPWMLANILTVANIFLILVISAIMGVAVLRDFEHNMEALLFSTPTRKADYLLGRFIGAFSVLMFVFSGIIVGMMAGYWKRHFFNADTANLLPFDVWSYINPFLIIVVPNSILMGTVFFSAGAISRKSLMIYTQGMIMFVFYLIATSLLGQLENKDLAGYIDPFGTAAFNLQSEYWTPAEKNTIQVPWSGMLLYNRLIWLAVAGGIWFFLYYIFNFNVVQDKGGSRVKGKLQKTDAEAFAMAIPNVNQNNDFKANWTRFWTLTKFYFKGLFKESPFIGIIIVGVLFYGMFVFINSTQDNQSYPTTHGITDSLGVFGLFFTILAVMYAGELIWKERQVKMNLIADATPLPDAIVLFSKFFAMVGAMFVLYLGVIVLGMLTQTFQGYFHYEPMVYIKSVLGNDFWNIIEVLFLTFLVQVLVNDKFVGYIVTIVWFVGQGFISKLGLEHPMWKFGSGGLGRFSDLNGFGHYVQPYLWMKAYWLGAGLIFLALAILLQLRGAETDLRTRWAMGKQRMTKSWWALASVGTILFLGAGGFTFYNHNVLHTYQTEKQAETSQKEYETTLKAKYDRFNQPKIVETKLNVELYPQERDFTANGYYILKNKSDKPINQLLIQEPRDDEWAATYAFDQTVKRDSTHKKFGFYIYNLSKALAPNDSMKLAFKINYDSKGFVIGGGSVNVVENGTFMNNKAFFPTLGYSDDAELYTDDDRKEYGLKPKERLPEQSDKYALKNNLFDDDADRIRFEITLGTDKDQIAIAPGYLQKEWEDKGRKYYHYKMDAPMVNFYNIVSGRFAVKRDKWNDVKLEVYYHPDHAYNVDTMMAGMKDALKYYTSQFGPFQYRQMRVLEVPNYHGFAQSFANTVPYDETGFLAKPDKNQEKSNRTYVVTAHEVAHQWWGHQVTEAGVKGSAMLSETMAQYSCMMVLKNNRPDEQFRFYTKNELNGYLLGRSGETKKEQPIQYTENQQYIHYDKGSVVMNALQDYIGEATLNRGIANYVKEWGMRDDYPTTKQLIGHFRAVTPDSLKYIIKDLFEDITLYENKAEKMTYRKLAKDKFEVTLKFSAEKFKADAKGNEKNVAINDWIDIGVFAKDKKGKDRKVLYLAKYKITKKENSVVLMVNQEPTLAGIDPYKILVDRHYDDNTKGIEKGEVRVSKR